MKNAMQLKAMIKNLSKEKHISAQLVLQNYMLERLLERISLSKYNRNFILKGGLLIASMLGLDARATMDMDITIKGEPLNAENVNLIFSEIINVVLDDNITFELKGVSEIREGSEHAGYRISLTGNFPPMAVPLKLDIGYSEMGEWWIPDTPQNKQIGMLAIEDDEKIRLSLFGSLDKQDGLRAMLGQTTVIHGKLRSGDNVFLSNCYYAGGGKWIVNILLKGRSLCLLKNLNAYSFEKVTVTYNGLEEWIGGRFWPTREIHNLTENGKMRLSGKLTLQRRDLISYKLDDCLMEINYRWNFNYIDSNLTGFDYIAFSYKNGKTYEDIERRLYIFGDFLLLCLGIPIVTDKVVMRLDSDNTNDIQAYFVKRANVDDKKVSVHKMLSYGDVQNDFQAIVNKWFELNFIEETRDAIAMYTESYEAGTVVEITFLILFQACEGLAKRIEPDSCKEASAKNILKHILLTVKDHLPKIITDDKILNAFTKKANDTRRYWVHNSGNVKKSDIFDRELAVINTILRYALRTYLLLLTGVPKDVISSTLSIKNTVGSECIAELEVMLNTLN